MIHNHQQVEQEWNDLVRKIKRGALITVIVLFIVGAVAMAIKSNADDTKVQEHIKSIVEKELRLKYADFKSIESYGTKYGSTPEGIKTPSLSTAEFTCTMVRESGKETITVTLMKFDDWVIWHDTV